MLEKEMKKVAVLGDPATVLGFGGLGFETIALEPGMDLVGTLKQLVFSDEYGIIYITNALAVEATQFLDEIKNRALPAIIPIPMGPPAPALGQIALKDAVRRAVGFDILANNEE